VKANFNQGQLVGAGAATGCFRFTIAGTKTGYLLLV